MSSRTSRGAQIGCFVAGIITWVVGVTFSFSSGAARALYGPSSPYAEYVADSCSKEITILGMQARTTAPPPLPHRYVADSCSKEITIIGCFGGGETGYFDSSSMLPVPPGDPAIPAWRGPGCGATVLNGVPTYARHIDEPDARTDGTYARHLTNPTPELTEPARANRLPPCMRVLSTARRPSFA